jgi:diadenosine tetraphosphate (Ap4A) HIT family hydrolase
VATDQSSWRTWRPSWSAQIRGDGCGLCSVLGSDENDWGIRILEGQFVDGYLWRPGSIRGYTVALWKHAHAAEPTQLSEVDAAGYWLEVLQLGRALEHVYRPAKMNYETLGNNVPHLHTHIIPRPTVDPAPNGPLPWTYLDEGRQRDAQLRADADTLRLVLA